MRKADKVYGRVADYIFQNTKCDKAYNFKMTFRARVKRFGSYEAARDAALAAARSSLPALDISYGVSERYHFRQVCRVTVKGVATRQMMLDAFAAAIKLSTGEEPQR